jgi:hypothetical protein
MARATAAFSAQSYYESLCRTHGPKTRTEFFDLITLVAGAKGTT